MRYFMFALLNLLFFVGNAQPTPMTVEIHVNIANPTGDSAFISDQNNRVISRGALVNGRADMNFFTIPGYYQFSDGNEVTTLYLYPGVIMELSLDTREFDESLAYTGEGVNESNYLAAKYLLRESFGTLMSYSYYCKLREKHFLNLMDSLFELRYDLLESYTDMDPHFRDLEKKSLDFEYGSIIVQFEDSHRYLTGDTNFHVSANFPDPLLGFDVNLEDYVDIYYYMQLVSWVVRKEAHKRRIKGDSSSFYIVQLRSAGELIHSPTIRDRFVQSVYQYMISSSGDPEPVYKSMSELISDKALQEKVDKLYLGMLQLKPGNSSPDFIFEDKDGEMHSLSDYRGYYVYIDIWATWCGPCLYELPFLEEMQKAWVNDSIIFISIAYSDDYEQWRSKVENDSMGGVQLFSRNSKDEFFSAYQVYGIPQFILIDPDGNIVDANAKRPSDAGLDDQLLDLLGD